MFQIRDLCYITNSATATIDYTCFYSLDFGSVKLRYKEWIFFPDLIIGHVRLLGTPDRYLFQPKWDRSTSHFCLLLCIWKHWRIISCSSTQTICIPITFFAIITFICFWSGVTWPCCKIHLGLEFQVSIQCLLTLLGPVLIKINTVSANFNNTT